MVTSGASPLHAAPDQPLLADRLVLLFVLACQGFTVAINGVAAPWIMRTFELDQAGMARTFTLLAVSAIGAFGLARAADRIGRRRLVTVALVAEALGAFGAALLPRLAQFIVSDIIVLSAVGATTMCTVVWLAELSSDADRAQWQALGGVALIAGSGPCVLLMPQLAQIGLSWRALLLPAALTPLLIPLLPKDRKDLLSFEQNSASLGERTIPIARTRTLVTIVLIATTLLSTISSGAVESWRYFHLINNAHVAAAAASWALIAAGAASVVGFPIGTFLSGRFDRVAIIVFFGVAWAAAIVWAFWGPPVTSVHPLLWVGGGLAAASASFNASMVASNTLIAELYPAELRVTIFGSLYLAGSLGRIVAHALVAIIIPWLGAVAAAVAMLAFLSVPAVVLLALFVRDPRTHRPHQIQDA